MTGAAAPASLARLQLSTGKPGRRFSANLESGPAPQAPGQWLAWPECAVEGLV